MFKIQIYNHFFAKKTILLCNKFFIFKNKIIIYIIMSIGLINIIAFGQMSKTEIDEYRSKLPPAPPKITKVANEFSKQHDKKLMNLLDDFMYTSKESRFRTYVDCKICNKRCEHPSSRFTQENVILDIGYYHYVKHHNVKIDESLVDYLCHGKNPEIETTFSIHQNIMNLTKIPDDKKNFYKYIYKYISSIFDKLSSLISVLMSFINLFIKKIL